MIYLFINFNLKCIYNMCICVCTFLDFISFSTSKENYLLIYYIIHSIIMSNHRRLLHVNNYIFKSSLFDDAPGIHYL